MKGYKVFGVDSNEKLIEEFKKGVIYYLESYNGKIIQEILKEQFENGNFVLMVDYEEVFENVDDVIVMVLIFVYGGRFYFDYLIFCVKEISKNLRKNQLIFL